jgi:hypothetical protein
MLIALLSRYLKPYRRQLAGVLVFQFIAALPSTPTSSTRASRRATPATSGRPA